jgi:SAM-dependent methyltransferase
MRPRLEVFVLALGALSLELSLTRLASFLLQYHYAFFAVAAGLGGMGLGTALAIGRARREESSQTARTLSALASALCSAALLVLPRAAAHLSLAQSAAVLGVAGLGAFLAFGFALGLAFEAARAQVAATYAADTAGAAVGTLAGLGALELGGPEAGVGLAVVAALTAAFFAAPRRRMQLAALGAGAVAMAAIAWGPPGAELAPRASPLGHRLRHGGMPRAHRWDAYARTDLVAAPAELGFEELYADGTAPAMIVRDAGDASVQAAHRRELPYLPFRLRRPRRVLSLGGGGGYDAWLARLAGASEVRVVEINAAALDLAAEQHGTSAGALRAPGVQVDRDDGRRFLQRTSDDYDLIVLALYQGQADARASIALLEATGYTREAVASYLAHLRPHGRVAILLHDRLLLERARRTAAAELKGGALVALEHSASAPYRYLLYFGPSVLEGREREVLGEVLREGRMVLVAPEQAAGADLSPTSDDRPFFFHTEGRAPGALWTIALLASVAALWVVARRSAAVPLRAPLIALGSGMGFAALELLCVQRLLLPLGMPAVALATVTAGFLSGSAAGALSGRRDPGRRVPVAAALLAIGSGALGLLAGSSHALARLPLAASASVSFVMAALLGFLAGRPLPFALSEARGCPGEVARLWAVSSLGAVAAAAWFMLLALELGYAVAGLLPALSYLSVLLLV